MVNQQTVFGGLNRVEVSVVLAAGFPMATADASAANLPTFDNGNVLYLTTNRNAYRLYVMSECSEGYYLPGTSTVVPLAPDFDNIFGPPVNGLSKYTRRRRPGIGTLISVDPETKRPFEARIAISTDYAPADGGPELWDGSGTWQIVTSTTWRLLDDRLGIEITDTNPNKWEIGPSTVTGAPFPAGVVNGIEAQATTGATNFYVRLTCVIEADQALVRIAAPRGVSPLPQTINRVIDASDRYRNEFISYPSEFNATGGNTLQPRDDGRGRPGRGPGTMRANTEGGLERPGRHPPAHDLLPDRRPHRPDRGPQPRPRHEQRHRPSRLSGGGGRAVGLRPRGPDHDAGAVRRRDHADAANARRPGRVKPRRSASEADATYGPMMGSGSGGGGGGGLMGSGSGGLGGSSLGSGN